MRIHNQRMESDLKNPSAFPNPSSKSLLGSKLTISRTFMNKIILITLISLFCGCTAIKIQKENLTITEIENEKYLKLEF